jgi:hypothetical protein
MSALVHQLRTDQCRRLIADGGVGRVAFRAPSGQQIIPVNYRVHRDSIVFRTNPYTELGSHGPGSEAAFEIDELDPDHESGWSVIARGRLHVVSAHDDLEAIRADSDPQPWADGVRRLYLALRWRDLTGRWLEAGPSRPSPTGGREIRLGRWTVPGAARQVRRGGIPPRY